MLSKKFLKHPKNVGVQLRGLGKRVRAGVGIETGITNCQSQSTRRQSRFAQTFARLLREIAEQGVQRFGIVRVLAKRVIVRDGLWLRVDDEFVGIASSRLAIERVAPLAKNFFEFFRRDCGELVHSLDTERSQRPFSDFADARNFPHRKRRKKSRFLPRRNPHESTRLRLIRSYFGDESRRREPSRTRKVRCARDGAKKSVCSGKRRSMQPLRAREI